MELSVTHIIFLFITLIVVIGGGIYAGHTVKSSEGYSLGGRKSGVAMVAGSIAGTVVGGGATVGTAQMAYTMGLSAWWFTLGSGIAFILMGIFYAGKLRSTGLETIPQFLRRNYGNKAATAAGAISSAGILFSAVASCLPGIYIVSAVLNVNIILAAVILILLVGSYVFFGGMKSAGVGGILKTLIIWITLFVAGAGAMLDISNMPQATEILPPAHWLNLFNIGEANAMSNLFSMIVGVICTQTYIQCFFSAENPRTATIASFVAAAIVIPIGLPSVAIGAYMHAVGETVTPVLVLPVYLVQHELAWLAGIALGGIMLSLVGSIGGLSLGIGTMLTRDIISKFVKLDSDRKQLFMLRGTVLSVMAVACGIAIANLQSQVLFWNFLSMAMRGCGVFIPLTVALITPRSIDKNWACASIILSTLIPLVLGIVIELPMPTLYFGILISMVMITIGYIRRWRPDAPAHKSKS